jgi:amino acid transporter
VKLRDFGELLFYITFGAGLAFGTSSFTMIAGLFEVVTGPWAVVSIVLAGIACVAIASSIAELASRFPSAPGIRTYLKAAFPGPASLVLVYLYLMFMVMIAAVEAYMFALTVKAVFPSVVPLTIVLLLMVFTILVNLLGLELPRGLQIATTLLLIFAATVLGLYGATRPAVAGSFAAAPPPGHDPLSGVPAAVGMAVYLFIGFEWVTMLGFRPESYARKIPVSMHYAILVNVVAYACCALGFAAQLSPAELVAAPTPQVPYFQHLLGPMGSYVAWGMSLLAVFSTFNAGIMGGSRLIYVLTREGNLPKWCGTMSLRTGAPVGAVLLLGGLAMAASIVVVRYELFLITAVVGSAIVCFVYAAFMLAAIKMRRTPTAARLGFTSPIKPWVQWAIIGVLPLLAVASIGMQPGTSYGPVAVTVLLVAVAWAGARWSSMRTDRARLAAVSRV